MADKKIKSGKESGTMSSNTIKAGSDQIVQKPAAQFGSLHNDKLDFESLVKTITKIHENLFTQAVKAVNVSLTIRNWLIGLYIHEYELGGRDRAAYGEYLLEKLANRLHELGIKRVYERELRRYRQFYLTYPQIRESLPPEFNVFTFSPLSISLIRESLPPEFGISGIMLIEKLSFTHIVELMQIENSLKRAFYEIECIRGNWSARELKRQIASLYYERSGLSKDKEKLSKSVQSKAEHISPAQIIRDPYIFDFLGIKSKEIMSESELEDSLLDKLQEFLLELGHGFCFEARQKRILIGDEYFFVDLVFYHRILKCHVLLELKVDDFSHEYIGQLNTYVNWFRKNEMTENDNPPIGILLCTQKNQALVEYATAGMDNNLFVSKYQLELPKEDEIRSFLERQIGTGSTDANK
jgi:predicted nuclease of restriction endonuclease-like (RecB) superfamily